MPAETIVVHKGHGLPYSKGLMAQRCPPPASSPERSFELARADRAAAAPSAATPRSDVSGAATRSAEEVLLAEEGESAARATAAGAGSTGSTGRWWS